MRISVTAAASPSRLKARRGACSTRDCCASMLRRSISAMRSPIVLMASAMTLVARSCRSAEPRSLDDRRSSVFSIQRVIESSAPAVRALASRVMLSRAAAWPTRLSIASRDGAGSGCRGAVSIRPCDRRASRSDRAAMSSCSGGLGARASSLSSRILWSSHSPSVMPARRAAAFAASRVRGSTPFTLQGKLLAMILLA